MKNVLLLTSVASMIQQFNMANIQLLENKGYDVNIACNFIEGNTCSEEKIIDLKQELNKRNIKYYQIDFCRNVLNLKRIVKTYKQTKTILAQKKYNFLHCHSPIGGVIGRLAGYATKTKVIYTAHGFHFYKGAPFINWLIYYPIEKVLSTYTDILITINKEDYEFAKKKMRSKQIYYLPGVGIDTKKFSEYKLEKNEKRKELKLPINALIIFSVGELNNNKNHEIMIDAIAQLNNPNIHYVIAGKGELYNYLLDKIRNLKIEEQVHLLGFRSDVIELYKASDIFCLPSHREGLSVALIEAMASGLPCICSKIRGNVDLIVDGEGGYLVDNTSSVNYVNAVHKLLNANFREAMSKFNMSRALQFSSEYCDNIMNDIYSKI